MLHKLILSQYLNLIAVTEHNLTKKIYSNIAFTIPTKNLKIELTGIVLNNFIFGNTEFN